MIAIYTEPMYTWEEERPCSLNVRWSPEVADKILSKSRSVVIPIGTILPREGEFDLWQRLTGGYTL